MGEISAPSFFHGYDDLWIYPSGTSDGIKKGNHHLSGMYRSRLMKKTEKRRHIIQLIATIVTNGYLVGFMQGKIQTGGQKFVCVPGLNCYSCPGAIGACPIGALQAVLGDRKFQFSYYVFGFLLFVSVLLGRVVCGFLCPFGFLQDLLYKIKSPKIKVPMKLDKALRYLKYVMLAVPVILLPIFLANPFGIAPPYFCQYICPAGTLEGGIPLMLKNENLREMIGWLFSWKMFLLILTIVSSILICRPFCKYVCPLGAFYGLFQRFSFYHMEVDASRCDHCGACEKICPMGVEVTKNINSPECIRCGQCKSVCHTDAISAGFVLGCGGSCKTCKKEKEA